MAYVRRNSVLVILKDYVCIILRRVADKNCRMSSRPLIYDVCFMVVLLQHFFIFAESSLFSALQSRTYGLGFVNVQLRGGDRAI